MLKNWVRSVFQRHLPVQKVEIRGMMGYGEQHHIEGAWESSLLSGGVWQREACAQMTD